jgi:hypothetical protein
MDDAAYLNETIREFRRSRKVAEGAIAQVPAGKLAEEPVPGSNSVAILMKHVSGNLRSRWTDFLTTDGEKPDRDRDREFELDDTDDPARLRAAWDRGWDTLFATLAGLTPGHLESVTVRIRGEELTVVEAIQRQLTHYAYHVGQIVYVAKLLAGPAWKTLSIPRGGSKAFNEAPKPYRRPE